VIGKNIFEDWHSTTVLMAVVSTVVPYLSHHQPSDEDYQKVVLLGNES
jgi:hypothetical protein